MAFYTSRIAKLNESEIRKSARSLSSAMDHGGSCYSLSARSCDAPILVKRDAMKKNSSLMDVSIGETFSCPAISETQSDIVPPLDLMSEENYSPRDYTFSYRNHCEEAKIVLKPDKAYETWLSAKRKTLSDEAAKRKKQEEMKKREIEERKRLAKEKYENWLEKKSHSSVNIQSNFNVPIKPNTNLDTRMRSKFTAEEARVRLEEWERSKRLKEKQRRMLKREEERRRRELEEQRRQMSVEAWKNWIANVSKKPKPVPLNRGIFTLRGTVSSIFINPNEWKQINSENNE